MNFPPPTLPTEGTLSWPPSFTQKCQEIDSAQNPMNRVKSFLHIACLLTPHSFSSGLGLETGSGHGPTVSSPNLSL